MTYGREKAARPEDLARLFVERANAGDAEGLAELYEPDAVLGFPPGEVTVGRELTKQFEEIDTVPAQALSGWLSASPQRTRGEFALVLHPLAEADDGTGPDAEPQRVLRLLLAELPTKAAVKLAADITKAPRNALYALALQWKGEGDAA